MCPLRTASFEAATVSTPCLRFQSRIAHALARKALPRNAPAKSLLHAANAAPAITFVGIGGVLEPVAAQRVQHLVWMDSSSRKIRNQVVRVGVEQTMAASARKPAMFSSEPCALKTLSFSPAKIPGKTAMDSAARKMPCRSVRIEFD